MKLKTYSLLDDEKFCVAVFDFIWSDKRNIEITGKFMSVYLRNGRRLLDATPYPTCEIARITVKEKYRRQGMLRTLIAILGCGLRRTSVYIENFIDPELVKAFVAKGWTEVADNSVMRKNPQREMLLVKKLMRMKQASMKQASMKQTSARSAVTAVPHEVTLKMSKDTHSYLVRKSKEVGCHSVGDYLLSLAGADTIDASAVQVLLGIASQRLREMLQSDDALKRFTFRSLFTKAEWSRDNFKTHQRAEEMFRTNAWTKRIVLVAKFPNKYAYDENTY